MDDTVKYLNYAKMQGAELGEGVFQMSTILNFLIFYRG